MFMSMFKRHYLEQEELLKRNDFVIPKKTEILRRDSSENIGHSLDMEMKKQFDSLLVKT